MNIIELCVNKTDLFVLNFCVITCIIMKTTYLLCILY